MPRRHQQPHVAAAARISWFAAVAAALLMFGTAALGQARARTSRRSSASPALFNRETYAYTSTLSTLQEASRYQVMVLQSTDAAIVPALKAANPNLKVLVYEGIMAAQDSGPAIVTCTAGPWVLADHPAWILKGQSGRRILYQNHYLMDVGNAGYQQTCVQNAIATAKAAHFDGVCWDMVNSKLLWTLPSGVTVPEYPTDAGWQAAMYSMVSYAGSQLHSAGLMNVANIGGAFLFPGLWQHWNGPLDGAEEESWTAGKQGLLLWAWRQQLSNAAWSEANHKLLLLHSWNTTLAGNVFGLASMMLVAGGESSYSTSNGNYVGAEAWYPEYGTAERLGAPLGPYVRLRNGVYERRFASGLVLVNPRMRRIRRFSLPGRYSGPGLTGVRSVSMGPASALILRRG